MNYTISEVFFFFRFVLMACNRLHHSRSAVITQRRNALRRLRRDRTQDARERRGALLKRASDAASSPTQSSLPISVKLNLITMLP